MLAVERMKLLLSELNMHGKVTVNDLAGTLNVSKETIRRDLDVLSSEGKLVKVHGGAIKLNYHSYFEKPFHQRSDVNLEQKRLIGGKAVQYINDNDVISLGIGTTTLEVAKQLNGKTNLTIITGSVSAMNVLIERRSAGHFTGKIIFIGGEIDSDQMAATGYMATEMLNQLYIDKAFMGANGYSLQHGITTFYIDDGFTLRQTMKQANSVYLLIDESKLEANSVYKYAEFSEVKHIVCNVNPPAEWLQPLKEHNVNWIKA